MMSIWDVGHHHKTSLYMYHRIQPVVDESNTEGAVVVITNRAPNEAWLDHVDEVRRHRSEDRFRGLLDFPPSLGAPDYVYTLRGHWPEKVIVYPGCFSI